ncbi:MAG: hypothetical protein AAGC74_13745 [Verrucomicrobiota bacterium]
MDYFQTILYPLLFLATVTALGSSLLILFGRLTWEGITMTLCSATWLLSLTAFFIYDSFSSLPKPFDQILEVITDSFAGIMSPVAATIPFAIALLSLTFRWKKVRTQLATLTGQIQKTP